MTSPDARFFIGIDPATHCGYAVLYPDGTASLAGEWDLRNRPGEGAGMRLVRLRSYMAALFNSFPGSVVAYETVISHGPGGSDAAHLYGAITGQLQAICEERAIPYRGINVGTVKRVATGKGNSAKDKMIVAAKEHWPDIDIKTDNIADALWIAETLRMETLTNA